METCSPKPVSHNFAVHFHGCIEPLALTIVNGVPSRSSGRDGQLLRCNAAGASFPPGLAPASGPERDHNGRRVSHAMVAAIFLLAIIGVGFWLMRH